MLAGIESCDEGTISYATLSAAGLSDRVMQQSGCAALGMVFQQPLLFAELTVLENVALRFIIHGTMTDEIKKRACDLLEQVGLQEKIHHMPHTLSGGQQQRVALLRALLHGPKFLLADEPTGSLDIAARAQVLDLLFSYQKQYGMGLIISTHDMPIAQRCDFVVRIENKQIILQKNMIQPL